MLADLRTSVVFAPEAVKRNAVTASLLCNLGVPETGLQLANHLIQDRNGHQPPCIDAYFSRALCHISMGQYKLALRDTSCISRIFPNNLLTYSLRAVCLFQLGHGEMALKQLRHFLEMKKTSMTDQPQSAQGSVLADLANVALLQKDFKTAVSEVCLASHCSSVSEMWLS